MKQVFQNPKSGKTHLEEITPPRLHGGGVLVRNTYSVISVGTERNIIELSKKSIFQKAKERPDYVRKFFMLVKTKGLKWAWGVAQSKLSTDIALGYSTAGEVIGVAADVEGLRVGDRVACAGQNYASHAEVIFAPKNLCVKIPTGVSERDAAFGTLGAIAMQGIRRAELTPGESVAVVGMGLLGQLAVRMLRAYGHPVIGFDVNPAQIDFAIKHSGLNRGVTIGKEDTAQAIAEWSDGRGADAVLIYASAKSDDPLKLAVQVARDKGRIVQIGNIETNIPWRDFYAKELTYHSSRSYGPGRYDPEYEEGGHDYPINHVRWTEQRNIEDFLRLIKEKKISLDDLVTATYPIADAEKAYESVSNPQGLVHGLVLTYPTDGEIKHTIHLPKPPVVAPATGEKVIQIGLIGLGAFMTSEILPHLKKVSGVHIRGVAHGQGLPAKASAEKWGADYVTADYKEIINDKDIDLVICATRHSSHAKIAEEVLLAGKSLYMEKPLALDEDELRKVIDIASKAKGKLFVGFNRRFSYHITEARKEFANSKTPLQILYRINYALESHWTHDFKEGGRIIGEACHFTDLLQFVVGSRPKRLWAGVVPVGGAVPHEENFSFTVEYENGSLGTVIYSGLGNFRVPKEYIEIYGEKKIMIIDNFKSGRVVYEDKDKKLNQSHQHKGYLEELELLIGAIREGKPSPISLDELFVSHMTIFKVMESLKTGEAVEFHWN